MLHRRCIPSLRPRPGRPAGLRLGRGHRPHGHFHDAGHLRLSGVGTERELAPVRRQPAPQLAAGPARLARRNDDPVPPPRLSLGHGAQAVRQTPPRQSQGPVYRQLEARAANTSTACTTSASPSAASSTASCANCCTKAAAGPTVRSHVAKSTWPATEFWSRSTAPTWPKKACGWLSRIRPAGSWPRSIAAAGWMGSPAAAAHPGQRLGRLLQDGRRHPGARANRSPARSRFAGLRNHRRRSARLDQRQSLPAGIPTRPVAHDERPPRRQPDGPRRRQADRARWVFAAAPITWRRWVVTWELDQLDGASKHNVLDNVTLLPG